MLAWENEVHFLVQEKGPDHLEIVVPSISILAEPPVSVATGVQGGARDIAAAYTDYLYTYKRRRSWPSIITAPGMR